MQIEPQHLSHFTQYDLTAETKIRKAKKNYTMNPMSTPRILPSHLHAFAPGTTNGNTVRMLGQITTVSGDQATLTCGSDAVTILLSR
jgi:hypothetical protein